jgi:hypothetical protein
MRQTDGGRQRELHSYKLSTMNGLLRAADSSLVAFAREASLRNGMDVSGRSCLGVLVVIRIPVNWCGGAYGYAFQPLA